jgi:Domain of unknown function (DUF1707)
MAEFPDVRVGTTERERALDDLARHFSAGRLSVTEFNDRSGQVAAATTRNELAEVLADLPPLIPEGAPPKPIRRRRWDWRAGMMALTPVVSIVLTLSLHSWLYLLLIPAVPAALETGRRALPTGHRKDREIESS